jgi:hypothetical protein
MQTLKIEIPNGFEIASFDTKTGEIKFKEKPKNVTERILTIADVLSDHGLTVDEFNEENIGLEPDEVAYRLLKMLTKSLNEGWTPDWDNSNEPKYYNWFYLGGSSGFRFRDYDAWYTISFVGSRLCFKSSQLAEHAAKHFTSVYKQFMVIE